MTAQPLSSLEDIETAITAVKYIFVVAMARGSRADVIFEDAASVHAAADEARRIAYDDYRRALNVAEPLRGAINNEAAK